MWQSECHRFSPGYSSLWRSLPLLAHRRPDTSGSRSFPACILRHARLLIIRLFRLATVRVVLVVGVDELPPGDLLVWDSPAHVKRRWEPPSRQGGATRTDDLRPQDVRRCFGRYLASDVPVIPPLGVESASLRYLAVEVHAYTIRFDDGPDEWP